MKAADLTRAHLNREVVIRMGRDRVAGIVLAIMHRREHTEVTVLKECGFDSCCLSGDDEVEIR